MRKVPSVLPPLLLWLSAAGCQHRQPGSRPLHVVLVGASIGESWKLAEWPQRVQTPGFTAESVAAWQFDKTDALEQVLMRPSVRFRLTRTYLQSWWRPPRKPDMVILKECSSYFPGDLSRYQESVTKWTRQIQAGHIRPVLATVVPVTADRAARDRGKQEAILEYNRWLREFARAEAVPVLDLEAALRVESPAGFLRDDLTSGDGSHLNAKAYAILDGTLQAVLETIAGRTDSKPKTK